MHRLLSGFAVAGVLVIGSAMPTLARPVAYDAGARPAQIQHVDWDDHCGPRCQAERREARARQREIERRRIAEHRRWEHRHDREEYRERGPVVIVPDRR